MEPTQEQIVAVIAHFKDIAPRIRQYDIFGRCNRDKIDAQITVLEENGNFFDESEVEERISKGLRRR